MADGDQMAPTNLQNSSGPMWADPQSCVSTILLIGPTGSGKTPLGDYLAGTGLGGRRCAHFDFGEHLRAAVSGESPEEGDYRLSAAEARVIRDCLSVGRLLSGREFPIALKLLSSFIGWSALKAGDWLVLNGLPRDVDQAGRIDSLARVELIVQLDCGRETVFERIKRNTGGDRTVRDDDAVESVRRKLDLFEKATLPLVDYYGRKMVRIVRVAVSVETGPEDVARLVTRNWEC
ncbi:MAG: nucleoside monophosphate kinase [Kiritimatiellia bacterium]